MLVLVSVLLLVLLLVLIAVFVLVLGLVILLVQVFVLVLLLVLLTKMHGSPVKVSRRTACMRLRASGIARMRSPTHADPIADPCAHSSAEDRLAIAPMCCPP